MKTLTLPPLRSPNQASKIGLTVDSRKGQVALAILSELQLIDQRYKIGRSTTKVNIPLARRPTKEELERIEDMVGEFYTQTGSFEPHEAKPESLEEALSLLPPGAKAELPRAFDIIGDLAIVELTDNLAPFQGLIANALMTVHKNIRAVYGKAGPISGDERVRPLNHLAGEDRTETIHREFGASFKVDISKVFFSPRLSQEHQRVASLVKPNEHVVDMFAGVGPFTVLIAKSQEMVRVDAIDLNADAVRLLEENVRLNHATDKVTVWNGNVRTLVKEREELSGVATRVIMNHPSQASLFVETATQALRSAGGIIHYYTFAEGIAADQSAVAELEDELERVDWNIEQTLFVRKVRGTSPMAWQMVVDARVAPA